jgi:hypothetical protein
MAAVWFRLYGELNGFLRPDRRARRFIQLLYGPSSIEDTLRELGVPHADVDVVVVNGIAVDFNCILNDGDRVAVYPRFHSIDLGDLPRASGPRT